MRISDYLGLAALVILAALSLWFFLAARTHFDSKSPRRPLLFALEALSGLIAIGTVFVVLTEPNIPVARAVAAIALATGAGSLFASALRATRKRNFGVVFGRTVPGSIVESGPYRFIRHPLYSAYILNWAGCAVLSASFVTGVAFIAIVGLYLVAARHEERDLLASPLGPAYAQYRSATGLLFPRLK